jgi:hypothetical protein
MIGVIRGDLKKLSPLLGVVQPEWFQLLLRVIFPTLHSSICRDFVHASQHVSSQDAVFILYCH